MRESIPNDIPNINKKRIFTTARRLFKLLNENGFITNKKSTVDEKDYHYVSLWWWASDEIEICNLDYKLYEKEK